MKYKEQIYKQKQLDGQYSGASMTTMIIVFWFL